MKEKDLKRSGKLWNGINNFAQDREGWKVVMCGMYPGAGAVRQ